MRLPLLFSLVVSLFAAPALAQSPARIDCTVLENGHAASGWFKVLENGKELTKGSCGTPADVPAGSYEVVVGLDGALDAPERRERVQAKAGQIANVRAQFETGELLVEVTRGRRRSVASVRVIKGSAPLANASAGVAFRISVGTYKVAVESRGDKREFDAVTISARERRVISVDFGS